MRLLEPIIQQSPHRSSKCIEMTTSKRKEKKMNKRLLTLWVLLLVGVLLAACGGTAAEPTAAPETTEVDTVAR